MLEVVFVVAGRDSVITGVIGEMGGAVGDGGRSEGFVSSDGEDKDVGGMVKKMC